MKRLRGFLFLSIGTVSSAFSQELAGAGINDDTAHLSRIVDDGSSITFTTQQTFDRLFNSLRNPAGTPRVTVPAGDYSFLGHSARFATSSRRE